MDSRRTPDERREGEWTEPEGGSSIEEIAAALEKLRASHGQSPDGDLPRHEDEAAGAEIAATLDHVRSAKQADAMEAPEIFPAVPYGTPEACSAFAKDLGDQALGRALTVFEQLEVEGRLNANQLAETLGLPAEGLWGTVSNPIKRQADALELPMPYDVVPGPIEEWVDSAGVAPNLVQALRKEMGKRIHPLAASEQKPSGGEDATDAKPAKPSTKYAALTARLEQLDKGERRFSLEQIESVLGFELPPKAWGDSEWWANDAGLPYLRHAEAWLEVGWRVAPDLASQSVVFHPASDGVTLPARRPPRKGIRRIARSLFKGSNAKSADVQYTEGVSTEFAAGLSDQILLRAECLFRSLAKRGEIESGELAKLLTSDTSRLGGQLATPLRRRAHVLALDPPYEIMVSADGSRRWRPASGAEIHLPRALTKELRSR